LFIYFQADSRAQWSIKKSEIQDKKIIKEKSKGTTKNKHINTLKLVYLKVKVKWNARNE
jgi:hypothetical protein